MTASRLLVLNAGSSSLKFAVFELAAGAPRLIVRGQVSGIGSAARFEASGPGLPAERHDAPAIATLMEAQQFLIAWLGDHGLAATGFAGIGHRIVHGGTRYVAPVVVTDQILRDLDKLRSLAPLHLPFGLGALTRMRQLAPGVPQIACFDTAFHAAQPDVATRLPLPRAYHDRGYRRYGFHGLNYEHVVSELPRQTGRPLPPRLLVAHLGNGASMCAIKAGIGIATTMGYSTADGLVMGTRSGAIDPGVLIALMRDDGLDLAGLEDLLYRKSGLLGLSGLSADMATLLASDRPEAKDAVDYYCYWAARHAGSLVTVLGGLDAVVFTGGVGENAWPVRARILSHLAWLGLILDPERNRSNAPTLSPAGAQCPVYIVPANEELAIARHVARLIG
jgi:acetate kinase